MPSSCQLNIFKWKKEKNCLPQQISTTLLSLSPFLHHPARTMNQQKLIHPVGASSTLAKAQLTTPTRAASAHAMILGLAESLCTHVGRQLPSAYQLQHSSLLRRLYLTLSPFSTPTWLPCSERSTEGWKGNHRPCSILPSIRISD